MTSLFVATPLHDARAHYAFMIGLYDAGSRWPCIPQAAVGTSLQRQRATLVQKFAASDCSHLLFVDSDIGWHADDAAKLLDTGKEFVGGTYARKCAGNVLTANLLPNHEGELIEATHVGTGFLLITRGAVERMLAAYADLEYESGGVKTTALFMQDKHEGTEDLSFCRRWRDIGGQVWMHTGVVLPHFDGNTAYVADVTELRRHLVAAA